MTCSKVGMLSSKFLCVGPRVRGCKIWRARFHIKLSYPLGHKSYYKFLQASSVMTSSQMVIATNFIEPGLLRYIFRHADGWLRSTATNFIYNGPYCYCTLLQPLSFSFDIRCRNNLDGECCSFKYGDFLPCNLSFLFGRVILLFISRALFSLFIGTLPFGGIYNSSNTDRLHNKNILFQLSTESPV